MTYVKAAAADDEADYLAGIELNTPLRERNAMLKSSNALYAMPWRAGHYERWAKVSKHGGCAMHGTPQCRETAVATVVNPRSWNAACAGWIEEHPEVEWRTGAGDGNAG